MHTNGSSNIKAHSNKPSNYKGRYCRDSGELGVFEASRYFSGDIDELSFGFERLSCKHDHAQAFPPQKPNEMKLIDKKHGKSTRTSSPPSRLASYLISFLLQRTPKSSVAVHEERSLRRRKKRSNMSSFYSCGACGLEESEVCEEKKAIDFNNWKVGRTKSFDQRFNQSSDNPKVLSRVQSGLSFKIKHVLSKRDDDDDLESDSSSDLFELSNIDADFHDAQSDEVPHLCGGSVKWSLST